MGPLLAVLVLRIALDKSEGSLFSCCIDCQTGIMKPSLKDYTSEVLLLIAFSDREFIVDDVLTFERD